MRGRASTGISYALRTQHSVGVTLMRSALVRGRVTRSFSFLLSFMFVNRVVILQLQAEETYIIANRLIRPCGMLVAQPAGVLICI